MVRWRQLCNLLERHFPLSPCTISLAYHLALKPVALLQRAPVLTSIFALAGLLTYTRSLDLLGKLTTGQPVCLFFSPHFSHPTESGSDGHEEKFSTFFVAGLLSAMVYTNQLAGEKGAVKETKSLCSFRLIGAHYFFVF